MWLCDIEGLVYESRTSEMTDQKAEYAQASDLRTLDEVIDGADMFLGLSGAGVLKPEMVAKMSDQPIIFALANPNPEIDPEAARAVAPNALIATGRSDFPNQVNNVLQPARGVGVRDARRCSPQPRSLNRSRIPNP